MGEIFDITQFSKIPKEQARKGIAETFFGGTNENVVVVIGADSTIQKAIEDELLSDAEIERRVIHKASMNELIQSIESPIEKGGLVARKVTIRGKDGRTYQATRWINPDTDSHNDLSAKGGKYVSSHLPHDQIQGHLQGIVDSDDKPIDKQRKLIAHGIYDKNFLDSATDAKYKESQIYLKEAGISDWKNYVENPNEDLPMTNSNPGAFSNPDVQKKVAMTVEEFQSEYGTGKAYEEQARRKDQIMKELQEEFGVGVSINDKWDSYETRLRRLFKRGTPKAVMAYGTGGVGKTYTLEKIRDELGLVEYDSERELIKNSPEYDYVKIGGRIAVREMQRLMFEHSKKTIVFDDCDSMWNDDGLINVLKNALDTSGNGKIQWSSRLPETSKDAGDEVPSSYTFSGRMVFITNLSKKELNKAGASPISESRASSVDLTMTVDQTLERLHDILKYVKVKDYNNEDLPITMEDKEAALETLSSIKHHVQVHQLNTRTLGKVIAEAMEQRETDGGYNKKKLKQFAYEELGLI